MFPVTFISANTSTVPVPLGRSSKFELEVFVLMTLPSISISSTRNLFWYITLSKVPKFKYCPSLEIVLPMMLTSPMSALFVVIRFVVRVVPVTSSSY